jgi:hypothetical protein
MVFAAMSWEAVQIPSRNVEYKRARQKAWKLDDCGGGVAVPRPAVPVA